MLIALKAASDPPRGAPVTVRDRWGSSFRHVLWPPALQEEGMSRVTQGSVATLAGCGAERQRSPSQPAFWRIGNGERKEADATQGGSGTPPAPCQPECCSQDEPHCTWRLKPPTRNRSMLFPAAIAIIRKALRESKKGAKAERESD